MRIRTWIRILIENSRNTKISKAFPIFCLYIIIIIMYQTIIPIIWSQTREFPIYWVPELRTPIQCTTRNPDQNQIRKVHFTTWSYRESNPGPPNPGPAVHTVKPLRLSPSQKETENVVKIRNLLKATFVYWHTHLSLTFIRVNYPARHLFIIRHNNCFVVTKQLYCVSS